MLYKNNTEHPRVGQPLEMALSKVADPYLTFNKRPDPIRIGELLQPYALYTDEPHVVNGTYVWQPKWPENVGVTGLVPAPGISNLDLIDKNFTDVPSILVSSFKIGYTLFLPNVKDLRKCVMIGVLPGVPSSRPMKNEFCIAMAKLGAICFSFDMLGMGANGEHASDKPHEYGKQGEEPNEHWDWKYDVEYVHRMVYDEIMPKVYGEDRSRWVHNKWIFQADDWGTGIQNHLMAHPTAGKSLYCWLKLKIGSKNRPTRSMNNTSEPNVRASLTILPPPYHRMSARPTDPINSTRADRPDS